MDTGKKDGEETGGKKRRRKEGRCYQLRYRLPKPIPRPRLITWGGSVGQVTRYQSGKREGEGGAGAKGFFTPFGMLPSIGACRVRNCIPSAVLSTSSAISL